MSAADPINFSPSSRLKKRRHKHRRKDTYKAVTTEITVKLFVNSLLSLTAIAALSKLLPYQQIQLAKLHLIGVERQEVNERVQELRSDFSRNFDPSQTLQVMQDQSPKVDPNQRRIFWLDR